MYRYFWFFRSRDTSPGDVHRRHVRSQCLDLRFQYDVSCRVGKHQRSQIPTAPLVAATGQQQSASALSENWNWFMGTLKWCLLAFATLFASSCWNWQLKLFTVAVQDFCLEYKARNFTEAADILIFGIQGQNTLYPQFGRQTNTLEPNLFESSCMLAESTLMYFVPF